jgi:NADH-quinone oxidoreductase subunit G
VGETDWQTALEYVANGLRNIKHEHGADALAALASPHSTVEELFLLKQARAAVGTPNVDFRLRQSDFSAPAMARRGSACRSPICRTSTRTRDRLLPAPRSSLLAARLRQAAKSGAKLTLLQATATMR